MNSVLIDQITSKLAELSKHEFDVYELKGKHDEHIEYGPEDLGRFIDHLIEKAQRIDLSLLVNSVPIANLPELADKINFPILVFKKEADGSFVPFVVAKSPSGKHECHDCRFKKGHPVQSLESLLPDLLRQSDSFAQGGDEKALFLTAFPMHHLSRDFFKDESEKTKALSPMQRLYRLLYGERREIAFVYIYAIVIGLVNLSLPLGIQATISFISGGEIFSSVVVLITLVVAGILLSGGLQIMQITIVELLQQRIFAKTAYEFAYRIPRIKMEALFKHYPPELMNRFFDVVNIQKGLPKLFVDITGAVLQIVFGLLLLSVYHPYFLALMLLTASAAIVVFYITSPKGLKTSLYESKYKYKIAHWLQEIARTADSFKMAGNTNMPMQKTDELLNGYLFYRKGHFKILMMQFVNILAFKTLVTGGMLVLGSILVVEREISLGQFVASEVMIVLIVGAVEKLVLGLETVYDLLTSVDKIAGVTDLPLDSKEGMHVALDKYPEGLHLNIKGLKYRYSDNGSYVLKGVDCEIQPGESICLAGANDSGKHTLVKVITGVLGNYEGIVTINHLSLRNISLFTLRGSLSKDISQEEIFFGSIIDNITMGRSHIGYSDVLWAVEKVGLSDYINALSDGFYTVMGESGKKMPGSAAAKLLLARAVASKPKLLVVSDFSEHIGLQERRKILSFLLDKSNCWTVIFLSINNDPILFEGCDRVFLMKEGAVSAKGTYPQLLAGGFLSETT